MKQVQALHPPSRMVTQQKQILSFEIFRKLVEIHVAMQYNATRIHTLSNN